MKYEARNGKICGIYRITNTVDGKIYVGKSKSLRPRYRQYVRDFEKQAAYHMNRYLLNAMNKHGIENFKMEVLEECHIDELSERELHWMIELGSLGETGYNLRSDTDQGMVVHPKTSERITKRLSYEWANGLRDGHSDKLKENWLLRNRDEQSALMTKMLTKWMYKINGSDPISYQELEALGHKSVLSAFHRKKSNKVPFKDMTIERVKV